jgi:undecaprenyl-diphosphatase
MDDAILRFFNQTLAHPVLDSLMVAFYYLSNPFYHIPVLVVALLSKRWRDVARPLLLTYLVTLGMTLAVQVIVGRPRPDPDAVRLIVTQPMQMSYPSGHTSSAFALALFVLLRWRTPAPAALGLLWAISVGIGRLYLAHHYPSDVLAGAVLGVCGGAATFSLSSAHKPMLQRVAGVFWLQLGVNLLATHVAYIGMLPWQLLRTPFVDKALHALLVGSAGFWLTLLLHSRGITQSIAQVPLGIALALAIALIEESLQSLSPLRTFDAFDMLGNTAGLIIAWVLARYVIIRSQHAGHRIS